MCLSSNAEPALTILADLVRHPAFAKEEIERARRETLDELILNLEQPGASGALHNTAAAPRSARRLMRTPVGSGTPSVPCAGHPQGESPRIHALSYHAANAILIPRGQCHRAGGLCDGGVRSSVTGRGAATAESGKWDLHPPHRCARTILRRTCPMPRPRRPVLNTRRAGGIPRKVPMDWFAGKVANALPRRRLLFARLNQEVRVKRGLSYGA